jgi:4-hydroxy-tetrahydrodipicolinate synthase
LRRGQEILDRCGDKLDLYSGDDATAMDLILAGARGDISVTANVAPRAMHDMCAAALRGDRAEAERINRDLLGLHKNLFLEANPIPVKWALNEMGLIPEGIRLPLTPLAESCHAPLRQSMQQAGLL